MPYKRLLAVGLGWVAEMPGLRDFRRATGSFETTRAAVLAEARRAEALGYDVYVMSDHLDSLTPIPLLAMTAENVGMRVGTYVLCNDFRHPVVMAQEAATLDLEHPATVRACHHRGWRRCHGEPAAGAHSCSRPDLHGDTPNPLSYPLDE